MSINYFDGFDPKESVYLLTAVTCLQRLPLTRDLSPSKESGKVAFWWTSIKEKPLELF